MDTATVQNYFRKLSCESRLRVEDHFAREVEEFSTLLNVMLSTLQKYYKDAGESEFGSPRMAAFSIMTKGAHSVAAGFELALIGYMSESEVLYRTALERFAVAWDVVHNPDRHAQWVENKNFLSTKSISRLKKSFEPVGQLYGYLSEVHVHTSPRTAGPPAFFSNGVSRLQFFGYLPPGRQHLAKTQVCFALLCAYVLLQITERVFHAEADQLETLKREPDGSLHPKIRDRHREFVDSAMAHFRTLKSQDSQPIDVDGL